jgi:hypothetical protein
LTEGDRGGMITAMKGRTAERQRGRRVRRVLPWCVAAFLPCFAAFLPFHPAALKAVAQAPDPLDALLDKAGDYVTTYQRTFVGVVAEETYRQDARGGGRTDPRGFATEGASQRRDLKSDVLLVRAPAGDRWIQFRDVFEVDGKPVRDRAERLAKLFLKPSASTQQQVDDIAAASARYNIGGVNRNVNVPVLALAVLEPQNRAWYAFKGRKAGAVFELEYQEQRGGTMIRGRGDESMPSRGRFTIDPETGRVLTSELIAENGSLRAQINVSYGLDANVGIFVPKEMRERYLLKDGSRIEGKASYAKFRRYQVTVNETVK